MTESERVLHRLRRLELLDREQAPASLLLAEMRELLAEAEAWVRTEAAGVARAAAAVEALKGSLERAEEGGLAAERTLVA